MLFISILLIKTTLTYYRFENCELRWVRMRKSAWKNVVETRRRCVMTFHKRNEIKLNDGSQSLTRNLCSTVATKRGLDRRKPRFFSNYIQSEMEVMLRAYMDLYTYIVYTVNAWIHLYRQMGFKLQIMWWN